FIALFPFSSFSLNVIISDNSINFPVELIDVQIAFIIPYKFWQSRIPIHFCRTFPCQYGSNVRNGDSIALAFSFCQGVRSFKNNRGCHIWRLCYCTRGLQPIIWPFIRSLWTEDLYGYWVGDVCRAGP